MTENKKPCYTPCAIERGMRLIGGKWKGTILWHLKDEPLRFNELSRQIAGVSKKMLTARLKELEEHGMVVRTVLNERPIAVIYDITEHGRSALGVLEQLKNWTENYETTCH